MVVSRTSTPGGGFPVNGNVEKYNFSFDYLDPLSEPFCVFVTIAKANVTIYDGSGPIDTDCTAIRSSGQNRSCAGAITETTLERTLVVQSPEDCEFDF